jgi:glutaredoxin
MNRVLILLLIVGGIGGYLHYAHSAKNAPGPMVLNASGNVLVELYATSWCGYCRQMRDYFAQNNIQYVEFDIEADAAAAKRHAELGGRGVPLIHVGKQVVIHGYAPNEVADAMGKN